MARKKDLRAQRTGTVVNATSKQQETVLYQALQRVVSNLGERFPSGMRIGHQKNWLLADIVRELRNTYPGSDFHYHLDSSSIMPDGGILTLQPKAEQDMIFPILIAEVKNQGTNDLREVEGLPRQARGNAIERLGKNVIGLRTALLRESIFPFVCFGYGIDFEEGSSILDRVSTMAMFGHLNTTYLHKDESGLFTRGSFYFRRRVWSADEMAEVMLDIAERSVHYYWSKYGKSHFVADS